MGLTDDEIERLDLARFTALADRLKEREKRWDIRMAKMQFVIVTSLCGDKDREGRQITLSDFLPPDEGDSGEQDNSKQLRMQLELMARGG